MRKDGEMNEHDRLWGSYSTASTGPQTSLTLEDMEAAIEKLRGLPPVKWMLIAPDGRVWAEEDPRVLMIILSAKARYGFDLNPDWLKEMLR